jgi:hypothetical protein
MARKHRFRFGLRNRLRRAPVARRLQRHGHHRQRHHQGDTDAARDGRTRRAYGARCDAIVPHHEALSENLLGLSFFVEAQAFQYANGKMVLEQ